MDADELNRLQKKLVAKKFGYWVATSVKGGTDYTYVKGTDTQRTENKRTESQDDKPFTREYFTECLERLDIINY